MKNKLKGFLIILSIVTISCGADNQQDLLTSTKWTAEQKPLIPGETPKFAEYRTFNKDGSYTLEAGEIKLTGQWKWTDKNEIYLQVNSITTEGKQDNFGDNKLNSYIRILEISEKNLKTLERFETDSWDSGFAKERTFKRI